MIKITDKKLCTGCRACEAVCPINAINFVEDEEGIEYPIVNDDECIGCGKCDKVCHMKVSIKRKEGSEHYYAGYLKQKELLKEVSSGGAAWGITLEVLERGGVVYGAVQERVDYVKHMRADTVKDARRFQRSKYLQSDIFDCFKTLKKDLESGKIVLFTGTACQIASVYSYVGNNTKNLYTLDVVCHGVPSIKVFRKYKEEIERKYKSEIVDIVFRDKSYGWNRNHYAIRLKNGKIKKENSRVQLFHSAYLQGLFYRPSCGECKYACLPRVADVTLADYWKYEGKLKCNNDNQGISLIVSSTTKGDKLVEWVRDRMCIEKTSEEMAKMSCRHLVNKPKENKKRSCFFEILNKRGYMYAVWRCTPKTMGIHRLIEAIRSKFIYE